MSRNPNQYHGNRIANRARQAASRRNAATEPVRLSQCMIVKDEEKNIERALSWAKGIVFEQIVVDTGSTDRTVEIAESMGAKVFHFEWIDDFSAAKNHAIDKARGNWIAFLDADEYFTDEHALKLKKFLDDVQRNPDMRSVATIECDILQLRDDGGAFMTNLQMRIFRNIGIHYVGRIHEHLDLSPGQLVYRLKDIEILHTGYTHEAIAETKKAERNIKRLRNELALNPDDITLKAYLADSLLMDTANPESIAESVRLHREVTDNADKIRRENRPIALLKNAYDQVYFAAVNGVVDLDNSDELLELCIRASKDLPDTPDFEFLTGKLLFLREEYSDAWGHFVKCQNILDTSAAKMNRMTPGDIKIMRHDMAHTALELRDWDSCIKYSNITLTDNKYSDDTLIDLMTVLRTTCRDSDREIIDYLRTIYDYSDPRDKLFLAKCAKAAKDETLMLLFYSMITPEEKASLAAG
ncbi:MAG: glycosyltransferase family 2 protein [Oscillospiraceae bacterium]|jgi:glycosyltransferase involved in cell wall biosynthesis|nr:glycosyltransferase family 2 protein [Oscillospiraceae bacterium]